MFPVILLFSAIFVSSASGSAVSPIPLDSLRGLFARQEPVFDPSTLPSQCRSRCTVVTTALTDCQMSTDLACGCTVPVEDGFVDCLNCLIALSPSRPLIDTEQEFLDQFVQACNSFGASLPSTTLSGAGPSATSGSFSATAITSTTPRQVTATAAPSSTNVGVSTITRPSFTPGSTTTAVSPSSSAIGGPGLGNFAAQRAGNVGKSMTVVILVAGAFTVFL